MGKIINIKGAVACDECWRIITEDKAAIVERVLHGTKSKEMLCMFCYEVYKVDQPDEEDEPEQDDE